MALKKLNLGCGRDIKEGYVNLDNIRLRGVDKVHNLNKFPYPFPDDYFDEIYTSHVLEHLEDLVRVMQELYRISKNDGKIKIKVPYFNCAEAFQDPTHKRFFTYTTFDYFTKNKTHYCGGFNFKLIRRELIPTKIGKLVPTQKLKLAASLLLGFVVRELCVELIVDKNN